LASGKSEARCRHEIAEQRCNIKNKQHFSAGAWDGNRTRKACAEGFSSHIGFRRQPLLFVRWTMPSPWRHAL